MIIAGSPYRDFVSSRSSVEPRSCWHVLGALFLLAMAALGSIVPAPMARALEPAKSDAALGERAKALVPEIETYIADGMKAFDVPGLAIGIVAGDTLVYTKGFGVRSKAVGGAVDPRTIFQIGSTTKAFLATSMAIMVDRGKLHWDDRIVDLEPNFQLKDPWVTREFRVFDLLAQRSGLPPYANDMLGMFGFDETALIRSLRHVDPVSSFRSTFAYTNITHLLAGRIVAKAAGARDGDSVLRDELLHPLGMAESSYTADAIMAAANHADGHRWTAAGTVVVPFTQLFPYDFGGAGDINSSIEEMARWLRLQLGNGVFEGRRIVSREALAFTRTPKVALSDTAAYALGWVIEQTPNATVIWHNGGTSGFGAYVGLLLDKSVGVVVLTNETNVGLPDAIGRWILDRVVDNPRDDHVANALAKARAGFEASEKLFAKPANPRPFPPLAPLAGTFADPSMGPAAVRPEGDVLVMEIGATGAKLKLEPWDGDVFTAKLMPLGLFAAMAENLGPLPNAFVQFQIDKDGRLDILRLTLDDGQVYAFRRTE